jgi:CheY-like chemotaxis protein
MPPPTPDDPPEAAPATLDGLSVLIVEDSWQVGTAIKSLLRSWGADVIGPVATAADALRLVSERVPDAALVDIHLRDGELAYGLIDRLHDQGIRVVVTTGYAEVGRPTKADAVLRKPVDEWRLLASLRPQAGGAAPKPQSH